MRSTSSLVDKGPLRAALPLLLFILWGCGGGSGDAPSNPPSPSPSAAVPLSPPTPLEQGWTLLRIGKGGEAAQAFSPLRSDSPDSLEAHRGYQDAMRAAGKAVEMVAEYKARKDSRPTSAMEVYLYGRAVIDKPEEARPLLEEAMRLDPTFPWPAIALARVMADKGDQFRSTRILMDTISANPRSVDAHLALGSLYNDLGMLKDAEDSLKTAERLAPQRADVLTALGHVYMMQDRHDDAIATANRVLALDPQRGDAFLILAVAHADSHRYRESLEYIEKAKAVGAVVDPGMERAVRVRAEER